MPLEDSIRIYERGAALKAHCEKKLKEAELKVEKIVLGEGKVTLDCASATVTCGEVVLCTNGFEDFTIVAGNGLCLDREFHRNVRGIVGYGSPRRG